MGLAVFDCQTEIAFCTNKTGWGTLQHWGAKFKRLGNKNKKTYLKKTSLFTSAKCAKNEDNF